MENYDAALKGSHTLVLQRDLGVLHSTPGHGTLLESHAVLNQ